MTLQLLCVLISIGMSLCFGTLTIASAEEEPTTITLEQAVHFLGSDGSDVVVGPGAFAVGPVDTGLQLTPSDGGDPVLLEAAKDSHDVGTEVPMAMSFPGESEEEADVHYVMLLLPDGTSFEAAGTYTGVRTRGVNLKSSYSRAKQRARQRYLAAQKRARQAAARAKVQAQQAAERAKMLALQAKREAERQAKIGACKVIVAGLKAGKNVAGFMRKAFPAGKERQSFFKTKLKNDAKFRDHVVSQMTKNLDAHTYAVPELKRISSFMSNPRNQDKLDAVFSAGSFCGDSIATMDQKLQRLGLAPKFALVRTRSATDRRFYMGYQVAFASTAPFQVGIMGVTDFRGNGGKYWFIGPAVLTNLAAGISAEVVFYPKVALEDFRGWGGGVGVSAGPPSKVVSGAVDVVFDESFKKFQGFGFGPGVGVGVSPVDAAVSYTHSWKY
jgi:hypothetical protein